MPVDEILLEAEIKMEKTVEVFSSELRGIRTGRATPSLVEHIKVDYYGAPTPLQQLATIAAPEANLIVIRPYDQNVMKDIEKAILKSNLGVTPQTDARLLRLVFPPLSEERRRSLVHQVKDLAEQARIAIRNVRRDANRAIDQEKKDGLISEDDAHAAKEEVQDLTKRFENKVDELLKEKSEELME